MNRFIEFAASLVRNKFRPSAGLQSTIAGTSNAANLYETS